MQNFDFWWIVCDKYFGRENFGEPQLTGYLVKLSMASHTPPCLKFSVEAMVQWYYVYTQDEWGVVIGEVLQC